MLTSTFQHLDGIGARRERELWSANVYSWEQLDRRRTRQLAFLPEPLNSMDDQLALSRSALQQQDAEFFAQRLAPQEYYRIALSFPSKTMFLDIETTGLSRYYNDITIIGWSLDGKYNVHIRGQDATQFRDAVSKAKALVTFNGSLFDLPFLRKEFPALRLPSAHIDAPLSLPKGRTAVTDDDPGRATFGITRKCERILKQRGVNVYPCLIRSMQNLTARGIRLAQAFRSVGIPAIESFPGGAQDILGIPRKRTGPEFLKLGLQEFGIQGEYKTTAVSHDELDAMTSAIVALFYWAGKYEALGNEEEDYLIVPRLLRE